MAVTRFRNEEIIGLGAAIFLHLALVAVLLIKPKPEPVDPVQTVTVSLAEDVGLDASAPDPVPESRAAMAPTVSDTLAPPELADSAPAHIPETVPLPPRRQPQTRTAPKPRTAQPPRRRPEKPASRPRPRNRQGGANRVGDNFLDGSGASTTTSETRAPAAVFGASEKAALEQAINRQLKPRWSAPQGADAEKLVTILSWRMKPDGSLAGRPKVVRQTGINAANRAQAAIHAERAIRAVQLAAPFNLPPEFYDKWKYIRDWRFDKGL